MNRRSRTSILIVNFNGGNGLKECLDSIPEGGSMETIVVDNASSDDSLRWAKGRDRVRVIENKKNLGFGAAVNIGAKEARGDFFLLLNPDAVLEAGAVPALEDFFDAHPGAAVAGGRVNNPDGSLQLACRRGFPTPWVSFCRLSRLSFLFPKSRLFGRYNMTFLDPAQTAEVDAVSGSFMAVRAEAFRQAGGMDEDYFLYAEDIDLCYRIKKAGRQVHYTPTARARHAKGGCAVHNRSRARYEFYNTMWTFHRKHFKNRTFFLLNGIIFLSVTVLKNLAGSLENSGD